MFYLLFSLLSNVHACSYHLNQTEVLIYDRTVHFGEYLNQIIQAKGYVQSKDGENPDYIVDMSVDFYNQKYFQHAKARLSMNGVNQGTTFSQSADTRCYTQLCSVMDGAKVIKKSINAFAKKLAACRD